MKEKLTPDKFECVVYCKRCHRKLTDINYKKLGYGKICYSKLNTSHILNLFELEVDNNVR